MKSAVKVGAHAQGTISYTVSPVHTLDLWLDMAKKNRRSWGTLIMYQGHGWFVEAL